MNCREFCELREYRSEKIIVSVQEVTEVEIKQSAPGSNMAVNETKILFESFLQKRKDTMVSC